MFQSRPGGGPDKVRVRNQEHAICSCAKSVPGSRTSCVLAHAVRVRPRDRPVDVIVAKRRIGVVSRFRVSKVSAITGIRGVVVAKRRTVVTLGLALGERKGERREKKNEMRGERKGERRQEKRRVDRRKDGKERRERKRGERESREDKGGKRERRGERG